MLLLSVFPPLSPWLWAIVDATFLIILISPALYFFVLRPLMLHISERKQAEEETALAYSELNQIFNTAADGMRLVDKDFNILRINETFSALSGVRRDEAIGKKCYEVFSGPVCFTPDCPLTKILCGEGHVEYEVEKKRMDGTKIPCIVTGTPFRGPKGELVGIVEDFKDITTHKQAAEAVRESEEKFRSISTSAQDGILMIDNEGNISYWNEASERIFGYTKEEALGKEAHILLAHKKHHEAYREGFSTFRETGKGPVVGKTLELSAVRKDGITFPIELSISAVQVQGRWHSISIVRDISERKQAEREVQSLKQQIEFILGATKTGLDIIDSEFNIRYIDSEWEKIYGNPTGKKCYEYFMGRSEVCPDCGIPKALETKKITVTEECLVKEGNRPIQVTTIPFQNEKGKWLVAEVNVDITERKKTEDALRAALRTAEDERLKTKSIIESIGEPLGIIDTDFRFVYQNKVHRNTFGEHSGELCYKAIKNRDAICEGCQMAECFRDGNIHTKERVVPKREAPPQYVVNTVSPLRDSAGKIVAGIEIIRDITEWRMAEKAMKRAHAELDQIFNTAADGMRLIDKDFNVLRVNNTFETLSGISKDDQVGKKCYEVFGGSTCHTPDCPMIRILRGQVRVEMDVEKERTDGIKNPYIVTATPFRSSDGELIGMVENFTDISERKKLEEQLIQAQKMEALGQLAGGIAHDFNNILTATIGFGTLLKTKMRMDDPLRTHVTQILNASERATNLTQALLAFGRKQLINPEPVNLNEIIEALEKLLSRIIGEDIELSTALTEDVITVMADKTQIEHILMNLATNARDAMPNGGRLTIRTEVIQFDHDFIKAHGYGKTGPYAVISVEDTGEGIDVETRERIFEPFYTTKETGKGTGLGLSMVYGTIKQHDGYINVYSEPKKGTTFKIYLPLIKIKPENKKSADLSIVKRGTEKVLVAEDDAQVRDLIRSVLEGSGYQVTGARDGEEAIRLFNKNKDQFELVILDVVMPKKNGKEVYDEIIKIKPDIKVVFTSGYNAEVIHKKGILEKGLGFVTKPSSPKELLKKVREVLDNT